jgi:serine O-acetyltransferase
MTTDELVRSQKLQTALRPTVARGTNSGTADMVWKTIQSEAWAASCHEPLLLGLLTNSVLRHSHLEAALAFRLASQLACESLVASRLWMLFTETLSVTPIPTVIRMDLHAVQERDPACCGYLQPFLYFKGFHALEAYRVSHALWHQGRQVLALYLQNRISEVFGVDIHPAARIGMGILIDHATGLVIGETAVVEDDVSILHEVTLGGTGKEKGERHPKIRHGVLIGAGAKILGNVEVGRGAKIGAGSIVLSHVPPFCTAVGVPARIIGRPGYTEPAYSMDHRVDDVSPEEMG